MASGTNNNVPLLSIAMPTWNRSANLQEALMHLLPQVTPYSKQIQIIISDNGSTDDTQDVIKKVIHQYPELNIIANKNDTNLGFYGNLWKCRQLSSGKYLWVLSDDDYVCEGLIQEVIDSINISKKLAVIYLKINSTLTSFIRKRMSRDQLLAEEGYHIGLISSVIFLNEKQSDKALYEKYPTSAFLGFIFLLHAFVFSRNVI
ncbi:MAG: glycosyltransferase family 2 protein, partial [Ginsengibacter sp.]